MDKNSEKDIRTDENAPLLYKYLEKIDKKEIPINKKLKFINIAYYQTDQFEPYPHYKPLSKIIKIEK